MSSASSASDSGIDLEKAKKLYGFSGNRRVNGTLEFPVKDAPPPLPEKDRIKSPRTKHLSHLPLAKINITPAPTKHRNRSHSFSSTPPATLMKLLRAQESTTKETQALLHAALSQLDAASARAAKAEAQIRARETSAILSHTQLTENAVRAHEAAARAHREAEAYKLQLRLRDDEVRRERDRAKAEERMRTEAEKEAERARSLAIKWRGEGRIMKAKEDGRKEGFGEGLKRGRLVIAAAISAGDPYESRRLVGDGAAYIEEYNDESDNRTQRQQRRRGKSRSRVSRSKKSESTRERVNSSSTRPRASEPATPFSEPPPPPPSEPSRAPPPPSESESQTIIIRRARSIQTDPSLFQSERTRSRTTSSTASPLSRHSLNQQQQQILRAPSPPPQIFVRESPPPPLPPVISPPEQEEQSIKSEPFSPQIPQTPQQFPRPQVEISPIPIPPPISQVPFAPGIFPPSSFQQQPQFQYAPSEPIPQPPPPVQPVYFPMPAPPAPAIRVVVTPAEEERDVQTPSTMTNENSSLKGLDFLHGFPAPPSRASSSGSAGPSRLGGGGFDPDLSTIHEHSREGTAFGGEEDFSDTRDAEGMTPDRSRNVEQWRMSLGGVSLSFELWFIF
ncbi:MAG: hypothetical protein NXY57DRAFT_707320 [Lentinula lateritia]|nr:MAG: hypothetical protein NXY57DRAFT_707320 [Lentinula lateritia]